MNGGGKIWYKLFIARIITDQLLSIAHVWLVVIEVVIENIKKKKKWIIDGVPTPPGSKTVTVSLWWWRGKITEGNPHIIAGGGAIIIPSLRGLANDVIPQAKFRGFLSIWVSLWGGGLKGRPLFFDSWRGSWSFLFVLFFYCLRSRLTRNCVVASRIRVELEGSRKHSGSSFFRNSLQGMKWLKKKNSCITFFPHQSSTFHSQETCDKFDFTTKIAQLKKHSK